MVGLVKQKVYFGLFFSTKILKNDKFEIMKVTNCPDSVDRDRKNFKNTNNIFRRKNLICKF